MTPNAITIKVEGATMEELCHGVAAAWAMFQKGRTSAYEAATAAHLRECLHEGGYYDENGDFSDLHESFPLGENEIRLKEMTGRQHRIAPLRGEADAAAVAACCAAWPLPPLPSNPPTRRIGCSTSENQTLRDLEIPMSQKPRRLVKTQESRSFFKENQKTFDFLMSPLGQKTNEDFLAFFEKGMVFFITSCVSVPQPGYWLRDHAAIVPPRRA